MISITNDKHWLEEQSISNGNNIFVITELKKITYKEFFDKVLKISNLLTQIGITRNSKVGVQASHDFEFFILLNSLWIIGAVPVLVNPKASVSESTQLFKKAEVNFYLYKKEVHAINDSIIAIDCDSLFNEHPVNPAFNFNTIFKLHNDALIMFTSGSTGEPKAVVHTFNSLFQSTKSLATSIGLKSDDVWLASLPLYHIGGLMILIRALLTGAGVCFPNSTKHQDVLKTYIHCKPTHFSIVTVTLQKFLESGIAPNDNLKYLFLGGGPISNELFLNGINSGFPLVKVYGSTETCSMVTALFPLHSNKKFNSSGKLLDEKVNSIKINYSPGNELGEILVRSNSLFKEYFNDKMLTSDKFQDGFYKTGDYGYLDEEGFLYINTRREDIIISGGENVSRLEIENTIKNIHGINDVFVFGIKDIKWGQMICAAIVSNLIDEETLKERLKPLINSYKIPKKFFFLDEIPRNELGKIQKEKLFTILNLNDL